MGLFSEATDKFAEIYGSALVSQGRMFVLAVLMSLVAMFAVIAMFMLADKSTAVPWLVEFTEEGGIRNKPVKIESINPTQAVIKAELAKFIVNIFTIDKALTPRKFAEANVMTKGLATTQFTEFRASENVMQRLIKEPDVTRVANVSSVDVSTPGVAFVFLTTDEARGALTGMVKAKWRVTLKYELVPPKTEADLLANPLGLYVNAMNITQETR